MSLADWRNKGQFFNYNSHKIFTIDDGQGEVLLLIHGFPTASWDWHKMWSPLLKYFRLLALDMIGFGFSDKPRHYKYSIIDQADLIETWLEYKEIKSLKILCHDYGDTVTQELLARQHSAESKEYTIESICFLNGGLFPETHKPLFIQNLLMSPVGFLISRFFGKKKLESTFSEVFGPYTQPSAEEMDSFWSLIQTNEGTKILHLLIRYMQDRIDHRERWVSAMQETTIPMRLIDGAYDPISGKHLAQRYKELIPNPDVIELENIGHFPLLEAPIEVVQYYLEFVKRA